MKRNYWIALAAAIVLTAAALGLWRSNTSGPGAPASQEAARPPAAAPAAAPHPKEAAAQPQAKPEAPSFDAVHVGPDGHAVIAGRAAPGAEVTVLAGGKEVGHGKADANGEFVILSDRALPTGPQALTLSARQKDKPPVASGTSLALVVPPHGAAEAPVAVLLPPTGPAANLAGSARAPHRLVLDLVEYDGDGHTIVSGRADSGTKIEVAIDDRAAASATADAADAWSVRLPPGVPAAHRFRLIVAGRLADGGDAGRIEVALRRPRPGEAGDYLAVVPGNNLWHLAERSYGDGVRYVEIYHANSGEIDDPNRIYPGQLLALPEKAAD